MMKLSKDIKIDKKKLEIKPYTSNKESINRLNEALKRLEHEYHQNIQFHSRTRVARFGS